jgi:LmbE family N-acetylglucosaminyl deacetylase
MFFFKGKKLLVIAAHPDDEVLGCGGTIAMAKSLGTEVAVQFIGEGVSARFPFGQYDNPEFLDQTNIRTNGAKKALKVLGITDYEFGTRLCGQFDKYPLITIVKDIERKLESYNPDILLTHNPSEVNFDHRLTYEAVEIACRPTRDFIPDEIYTFEIPCSGSWTFESTFKPNVFVDISGYWAKKLEAWSCYEGETRPYPFPRSVEGLKTIAQYRGLMSNLRMAEAFHLVRKIVSDK